MLLGSEPGVLVGSEVGVAGANCGAVFVGAGGGVSVAAITGALDGAGTTALEVGVAGANCGGVFGTGAMAGSATLCCTVVWAASETLAACSISGLTGAGLVSARSVSAFESRDKSSSARRASSACVEES